VPAVSSSLISSALEKLGDLPAGDRALLAGHCPSLAGHLASVPDPRDPRGVRHALTSLLLAAVAAVLAGARSFTAVGEWAADAPPRVLAALGVRYDPLAGCFQPPDEATSRRVLEALDAAALEAAVGSWLAARRQAGRLPPDPGRRERRAVAVDGKAVRGTWHASGDGQARHLLAAADQQAGAVLAQAEADGKASEITAFAPLLAPLDLAGAVVTADALHTQREHAQFLVASKHAHYILTVTNQTRGDAIRRRSDPDLVLLERLPHQRRQQVPVVFRLRRPAREVENAAVILHQDPARHRAQRVAVHLGDLQAGRNRRLMPPVPHLGNGRHPAGNSHPAKSDPKAPTRPRFSKTR
jgi:predicted transposase YbfD/YdcC